MKLVALLLILVAIDLPDVNKIAKINKLKEEASAAYAAKRYTVAINRYQTLIEQFNEKDDKLQLNLAHAYYHQTPDSVAFKEYAKLKYAQDTYVRSIAEQQMGNIAMKTQKLQEALEHYKSALKADAKNESARKNYELVKKMLEQQKKQNQNQQNQENKKENQDENKKDQEQQNKDNQENKQNKEQNKKQQQKEEQQKKEQQEQQKKEQEKQEQQKKEQEKKQKEAQGGEKKDANGDKKEAERDDKSKEKGKEKEQSKSQLRSERLQQMNMTEDQAKMVLDAMKSTEVQYLQQSQKRAGKKSDKTKPDW